MAEYNPEFYRRRKSNSKKQNVNCLKCQYLHITWDKNFPYACKVFGFKGKQVPSVQVRVSTGRECPTFKLKSKG
jgi:hypothetical protein